MSGASVDIEFLLPRVAEALPGGNGRHASVEVRQELSSEVRRQGGRTGGSGGSQVRSAAAALSDVEPEPFPAGSWFGG